MKGALQVILVLLFLFLGVPLVIGLANNSSEGNFHVDHMENKIEVPRTIKVWNNEKGKIDKMDFEDYVVNVVASEMPSSFEKEALKAQAVAARTYAMAKILKFEESEPQAHPKAPVCSSTHCQVFKSSKELIECHGDGWEEDGYEKIKEACRETEGELLYYRGQLVMQPLFFSSSGGQTENSEDVFSNEYPYLVSVSSPYEENASHKNETKSFSMQEIKDSINSAYADRNTGDIDSSNIKILSRTAGGRVDKIQIGQGVYKGTEVRSALGLSSALFYVSFEGEKINITSNGYGHGVGMSQYGANGMAKEGSNYREILTHYYVDTDVY